MLWVRDMFRTNSLFLQRRNFTELSVSNILYQKTGVWHTFIFSMTGVLKTWASQKIDSRLNRNNNKWSATNKDKWAGAAQSGLERIVQPRGKYILSFSSTLHTRDNPAKIACDSNFDFLSIVIFQPFKVLTPFSTRSYVS